MTTGVVRRVVNYYRDPRPDIVPAFKLMLSPEFRKGIKELLKYCAAVVGLKLPAYGRSGHFANGTVSFTRYMQAYDNVTGTLTPYKQLLARIAGLLELRGGEKVVDLGAGTGNLTGEIIRCGGEVTSIDSDPGANTINRRKNPTAELHQVNLDQPSGQVNFIPLPNYSVDRVCAANLWVYIRNRQSLYTEVRRLLKPEGVFVLAVEKKGYNTLAILKAHLASEYDRHLCDGKMPMTAVAQAFSDFIAKFEDVMITAEQTKKLLRGIAAGAYTVFTEAGIKAELEQAGFRVESCEIGYAGQAIILRARPFDPA